MKYDMIIFDCDGTLVNTEYAVNSAFVNTIHELANPEYRKFDVPYILKNCIGGTVATIFDRMGQDVKNPISQEMRTQIVAAYQEIILPHLKAHLTPEPELQAILKDLSSQFKICVASNGLSQTVGKSLMVAGLSDIFGKNVFTAENVAKPKPAPDLILYAAEKMGVTDMSRVLHIEDAARGAKAGVAAGANMIGYTGHTEHKNQAAADLTAVGAQRVFDNWNDIAAFILR